MAALSRLNLNGIVRMRASIRQAFSQMDAGLAPLFKTDATGTIALTAATHFTDAAGNIRDISMLYTTSATAVAISFAKTESDKLPLGTHLAIVQSAGLVTVTGTGGVTVTVRGTAAAAKTAVMRKVTAALWYIDFPG